MLATLCFLPPLEEEATFDPKKYQSSSFENPYSIALLETPATNLDRAEPLEEPLPPSSLILDYDLFTSIEVCPMN